MKNKPLAPNSIVALVTGILSINFSALVIPGIILAIIGLTKSKQGYDEMGNSPGNYSGQAMLTAGRTTSIVGLVLSIASIFFWILYIAALIGINAMAMDYL